MKKLLQKFMVIIMVLALVISGCGKKNGDETGSSGENVGTEGTSGESSSAEQDSSDSESTEAETLEPPVEISDISEYVVLGQYLGVEASRGSAELTEEEIQEAIDQLLASNAERQQITEGVVADGDTVYIDYVGRENGVEFSGGSGSSDLTIGSGQFIPGFEEGLIGVNVGDTVELPLTFPEDFRNSEMAGKEVVFTVTVQYIVGEDIIPEFNDELAARLQYASAEELRADLVDSLKEQKETEVQNEFNVAVWTKVIENCEIKPNEDIYNSYYDGILGQYQVYATMLGMELKDYMEMGGIDYDEFLAYADEYAENCMKQELVCRAVVEAEQMTVSDEEYQQTLSEYYASYSSYFSDETELENYYGRDRLICDILWSRVIDMVLDSAVEAEPANNGEMER